MQKTAEILLITYCDQRSIGLLCQGSCVEGILGHHLARKYSVDIFDPLVISISYSTKTMMTLSSLDLFLKHNRTHMSLVQYPIRKYSFCVDFNRPFATSRCPFHSTLRLACPFSTGSVGPALTCSNRYRLSQAYRIVESFLQLLAVRIAAIDIANLQSDSDIQIRMDY